MAGERDDRPPAPGRPAECPPIAVSARYRGIDGPDRVGGDFHARCEAAGRTRLILGDVRGKGSPAAGKARLLTDTFLAAAATCAGLEELSRTLDRVVCADAAAEADPAAAEWFATAVLLEIDADGRNATMINHGHPSPVLVVQREVRELAATRPRLPLGLGRLIPAPGDGNHHGEGDEPSPSVMDIIELPPDSTLILFTDGLSEARDRTGRMFDPVAWLNAAPDLDGPARLLDRLYSEAERHNGGTWRDDLALVSVRRRAAGPEAPQRPPVPAQLPKDPATKRPSPPTATPRTARPRTTAPRTPQTPTPQTRTPQTPTPKTPMPRPPLPDSKEHPPIPSPLTATKLPARPQPLIPTPLVSTPPAVGPSRRNSEPSPKARPRPLPSASRPAPPARPAPLARPTRPTRPT